MSELVRFFGAILVTYFVSRLVRRFWPGAKNTGSLVAIHAISILLVGLALFALRYPANAFALAQIKVYVAPQIVWLALDLARSRNSRTGAGSGHRAG